MHISALTLELRLPGCHDLKSKRRILKPLLAGLHRQYNVSAAEIGAHDEHQFSAISCVMVSTDRAHIERVFEKIPDWVEGRFPQLQIIDQHFMNL